MLSEDAAKRKKTLIGLLTILGAANVIVKKVMVSYMYNYPQFVSITQNARNILVGVAFTVAGAFCCSGSEKLPKAVSGVTKDDLNPMKVDWVFYTKLGILESVGKNVTVLLTKMFLNLFTQLSIP